MDETAAEIFEDADKYKNNMPFAGKTVILYLRITEMKHYAASGRR